MSLKSVLSGTSGLGDEEFRWDRERTVNQAAARRVLKAAKNMLDHVPVTYARRTFASPTGPGQFENANLLSPPCATKAVELNPFMLLQNIPAS